MQKTIAIYFLMGLPLILLAQYEGMTGIHTVLKLAASADNPRNSEGDFITLKDGRILFVYTRFSGGTSSDHAPAQLMARSSSDQGMTWSTEDQLIVDKEGDMNVMSVSLLRLQNGNIALFYARKNSLDDCTPQMRISKDEGKSWSDPKPCITDRKGYFVLNNDRVLQLKSGRLLLPVSLHKTSSTEWSHKGQLRCYYSDDHGSSWYAGSLVPTPDSIITQEPGVVELKDGKIMMIIRASGGRQYQSLSTDKGLTWSYASPTNIKSPISPASLERMSSTGDLLLVWNNNGETGPGYFKAKRTPLTIAISQDDGKTWNHQRDIENNRDAMYCYTAIHQVGGHMLLAYLSKLDTEEGYSITMKKLDIKYIYGN